MLGVRVTVMVRCGPAVNSHIAVFSRWLVEVLDRVHWRTDYHRAWGASRHGRGTTAASSDAEGCSVESVDASDKFPSTSGSAHVRLIHQHLVMLYIQLYFTKQNTTMGWRGGLVVGRRTCDLGVAGSRPGRDAAA